MENDWSQSIARLNLATAVSSIGRSSRGFPAELGEAMPFTTAPQRWLSFARASLRWSDLLGGLKGGFTAGSDLEILWICCCCCGCVFLYTFVLMTFVSISLPQKYQKWTPSQVLQVVEVDTMEEPGEEKKATCGSQDAWMRFLCAGRTKQTIQGDGRHQRCCLFF